VDAPIALTSQTPLVGSHTLSPGRRYPSGVSSAALSAWAAGSTSSYTEVSRCCRRQHRSSPVYLLAPPAFSGPRPVWAKWAECRRRHVCELFTRPPRVGTRSGGFPVTGGGCCVGECAGHGPLLGIHDCSCQLDSEWSWCVVHLEGGKTKAGTCRLPTPIISLTP
jgi:hypothetical protein